MNRRDFNKLSLGAAVAPLIPGTNAWASAAAAPPNNGGHQFSLMLWTLKKELTFEQRLQIAADAGMDSVEVGNEYEKWTDAEWTSNLAKLQSLGLKVDSAVPGRNALADKSKRGALHDDLVKAIPGCKRLGCSQFIYTAYTRVPEQTPEQQRAAIVDTLKYAADLLEKDNIEIVLEPIDLLEYPKEAVPSVAEAFEIVRAVGSSKVKVLYDFYHEQRGSGNLIEKLEKNIDLVGLVHIADVPGRHKPGTGEVNYGNVYRKLAELKYSRVIGFEWQYLGDPVAELKAERLQAIATMNGKAV
ncbi:MAG: TIM barrel protein [Janthinobacterium lividum]